MVTPAIAFLARNKMVMLFIMLLIVIPSVFMGMYEDKQTVRDVTGETGQFTVDLFTILLPVLFALGLGIALFRWIGHIAAFVIAVLIVAVAYALWVMMP